MPLMMDEQMDIDDLFGDGAGLSIPASRPPSKELHQRIDELRGSGCCQSIAWSKWGSIASISSDSLSLEMRNLRCNPEDGDWSLSEPNITPSSSMSVDACPLKHLAWSPSGSDLAVIDAVGRISILTIFATIDTPLPSRRGLIDPTDDLNRVVGCYWLNTSPNPPTRTAILHGPAVKKDSSYLYQMSHTAILGPYHPNHSKSALVCVTTSGLLKVLWMQSNGKWCESHTELESVVSSDDLVTHAAICPDRAGNLLIAFATTSNELRTVRAMIDWGMPKASEKTHQPMMLLNPTIKTKHLATTSLHLGSATDSSNQSQIEQSMVLLTHIEFLPPSVDTGSPGGRAQTAPTILTVRSYLPPLSNYNQEVHSMIDKWEMQEKSQSIHPAFEQLSSRRNSIGSKPPSAVVLKKLDGFTVNKVAVTMQPMNLGNIIFFAYSDGTVEYRQRTDFLQPFLNDDLDKVWHLAQIGFSYTEDEPCLQAALSPSYCSMMQIGNDGKVRWKQLDYRIGDIGSSMEDARYAGVMAALALSCSTAVMSNSNYDDLLATMHRHIKANFTFDWIAELSKILKPIVDYSEESHFDVLIRNTTIQLCLSMQQSLGFKGDYNPRTFSGKFAWIVLQLRNIVVVVTMAANMKVKGPNGEPASPLEDPEVINSLAGSVRWVLGLMAWIIDSLLEIQITLPSSIDLADPQTFVITDLLDHLYSTNNISLHLLLSSPTRGFLTAICRRLLHIDYIARKAMMTASTNAQNGKSNPQQQSQGLSPALRAAYEQIATLTSSPILRTKTFETLLSSLTSQVKTAYGGSANNPPLSGSQQAERARNTIEIRMMLGGAFPDAFKGVISELFRTEGLLDSVREEILPAQLFFADFSMLEVDEDAASLAKRKKAGQIMDCFRKVWLGNPTKEVLAVPRMGGQPGAVTRRWRRCTRCAAVMEDTLSQRPALQWLGMQQRRCFCSGYWDSLVLGKPAAPVS